MVVYACYNTRLTWEQFGQQDLLAVFPMSVGIWDGISVWIESGMAQETIQPFDELGALDMLQLLRNVVYFIPSKAQLIGKKYFPEPVLADQLGSYSAALLGKLYSMVFLVLQ